MRIGYSVHFSDIYLSGVEYYSLGVIRALASNFPENDYVVFTNRPGLVSEGVGEHDCLSLRKSPFRGSRLLRILWEHSVLPRLARRERLDVLHCPCYVCPAFECGVPYVVTVHDTIALDRPGWCKPSNAAYYGLMLRRSIDRASAVIADSQAAADDIRRHCCVEPARLNVIAPGIDDVFRRTPCPAELHNVRDKYGLPEKYILSVGNIEPKKNIPLLLRAYKVFRERGFPHSLVLAGGRTWRSRGVFAAIRAKGLDGNVVLPGYVDRCDLPLLYSLAEIYICSSLHEGFGFPPLEAMACGTPVVASLRGALALSLIHISEPTRPY